MFGTSRERDSCFVKHVDCSIFLLETIGCMNCYLLLLSYVLLLYAVMRTLPGYSVSYCAGN